MGDKYLPKEAVRRLQKEYKAILKEPPANIAAHPHPNNILEWHYVLQGSGDYQGGVYHGKVTFPSTYPYKPPSIKMYTPNGRFATNTRLCLSMSDFHPETWNPMWSVASILTGLLSFMHDEQPTAGSVKASRNDRRRFARESLACNMKNPTFRKLFPEWEETYNKQTPDADTDGISGDEQETDPTEGATQEEATKNQQGKKEPLAAKDKKEVQGPEPSVLWMALVALGVAIIMAIPLLSHS